LQPAGSARRTKRCASIGSSTPTTPSPTHGDGDGDDEEDDDASDAADEVSLVDDDDDGARLSSARAIALCGASSRTSLSYPTYRHSLESLSPHH
jgi:hypothetical protein